MGQRICTECGKSFDVPDNATDVTTCLSCQEDDFVFGKDKPAATEPGEVHRFRFTGSAGEYFRIWFVNAALTVLTLGFYAPWAKVRNRRYLYANTLLGDHPFDYRANPIALLKGQLIAMAGLGLYFASQHLFPLWTPAIFLVGVLIFPYLAYKALRFRAHNTAWRNLRFRFAGDLAGSYRAFVLIPLLVFFPLLAAMGHLILHTYLSGGEETPKQLAKTALTMPLAILWVVVMLPVLYYAVKKYVFSNFSYGKDTNNLTLRVGSFYAIYLKTIGLGFLLGLVVSVFSTLMTLFSIDTLSPGPTRQPLPWGMVIFFGFMGLIMTQAIQQYIYAAQTNLCLNGSQIGPVRLRATLNFWELAALRISNILAIGGSLGLLTPWAKIRRLRYLLENVAVEGKDLVGFAACEEQDDNALGEMALDDIGFEIGF